MKFLRWVSYTALVCLIAFLIREIVEMMRIINICIQNNLFDAIRELYVPIIIWESISLTILVSAVIFTIVKPTKYDLLITTVAVIFVMLATIKRVSAVLDTIIKYVDPKYEAAYGWMVGIPVCLGIYYLTVLVSVFIKYIPKFNQKIKHIKNILRVLRSK